MRTCPPCPSPHPGPRTPLTGPFRVMAGPALLPEGPGLGNEAPGCPHVERVPRGGRGSLSPCPVYGLQLGGRRPLLLSFFPRDCTASRLDPRGLLGSRARPLSSTSEAVGTCRHPGLCGWAGPSQGEAGYELVSARHRVLGWSRGAAVPPHPLHTPGEGRAARTQVWQLCHRGHRVPCELEQSPSPDPQAPEPPGHAAPA